MGMRQEGFPFPLSLAWWRLYFTLDSPSKCIVGEAHGFSSHYENECVECDRLGWEFGHSFLIRSIKKFKTYKPEPYCKNDVLNPKQGQ